jgi:hypothetical protein
MTSRMVRRKTVNKQIRNREGFDVKIKYGKKKKEVEQNTKLPGYRYKVALKNARNVKALRDIRFKRRYPGYAVDVLYANGKAVRGNTLLGTVRDTYLA